MSAAPRQPATANDGQRAVDRHQAEPRHRLRLRWPSRISTVVVSPAPSGRECRRSPQLAGAGDRRPHRLETVVGHAQPGNLDHAPRRVQFRPTAGAARGGQPPPTHSSPGKAYEPTLAPRNHVDATLHPPSPNVQIPSRPARGGHAPAAQSRDLSVLPLCQGCRPRLDPPRVAGSPDRAVGKQRPGPVGTGDVLASSVLAQPGKEISKVRLQTDPGCLSVRHEPGLASERHRANNTLRPALPPAPREVVPCSQTELHIRPGDPEPPSGPRSAARAAGRPNTP